MDLPADHTFGIRIPPDEHGESLRRVTAVMSICTFFSVLNYIQTVDFSAVV